MTGANGAPYSSSASSAVAAVMGKLPTVAEYMEYATRIDSMAPEIYRYLNFDQIADLQADVESLVEGFSSGKRLGLMIRNENANPCYNTQFMVVIPSLDLVVVRLAQGPAPWDDALISGLLSRIMTAVGHFEDGFEAGETSNWTKVVQ